MKTLTDILFEHEEETLTRHLIHKITSEYLKEFSKELKNSIG